MAVLYSILWLYLIDSIRILLMVVLVACRFHMVASGAEVSWLECGG